MIIIHENVYKHRTRKEREAGQQLSPKKDTKPTRAWSRDIKTSKGGGRSTTTHHVTRRVNALRWEPSRVVEKRSGTAAWTSHRIEERPFGNKKPLSAVWQRLSYWKLLSSIQRQLFEVGNPNTKRRRSFLKENVSGILALKGRRESRLPVAYTKRQVVHKATLIVRKVMLLSS